MSRLCISSLISLSLGLVASGAFAGEAFRYPEAKHGKGELRYIDGIPVLLAEGSPEEMGEQLGTLALKPARPLLEMTDGFIEKHGWKQIYSLVLKTGNVLLPRFPAHHRKELEAAAKASPWSRELLIFGSTISDMRRFMRCSTLIVEAPRSATGGPLFGRNLDWPPFKTIHEFTFVAVYRPTGKRAFASVTYPGLLGCSSGINDAGLAIASLDVTSSKDGSLPFNPLGTPTILALRRVLEECATVEEAEKLLRSMNLASMLNLAVCDKKHGVVFEITTKSVVVRPSVDGVSICTNHFRTEELATWTECRRYETLQQGAELKKHTVADIQKQMHAVNQGAATLQTMVFEPAALKLHLAFGKGPATRLPLRTLNLTKLFAKGK